MWLKARRIINGLPYTSLCVRPSLGRIGRISGDARLKALSIMAVVNEFLLYQRNLIYYKARMLIIQEYAVFAHCFRLRAKHLLCICVAWQIFTV